MLFPDCQFEILLPDGVVQAGRRLEGTVVIDVPRPIPRAEHLDLVYVVSAWVGYNVGKSRSVDRRTIFECPVELSLPGLVPAGKHRFPFAIDVPAWLPPALQVRDCAIEHTIRARLDVSWALDPKAVLSPVLVMAPVRTARIPLKARSPEGFHDSIVLEVTLASSVIAEDEALRGQVALRSGHDARFDAVVLSLFNFATLNMGGGDTRRGSACEVRLPAEALRPGEPVAFTFPPNVGLVPTFRNECIDNDVRLTARVPIPWASDPEFTLALQMVPAGSTIHGEASLAPVGGARLRLNAAAMAARTGLREGQSPVLVAGAIGPVALRIIDAPREGKLGIDAELTFPDLGLGVAFRPLGLLDGFRDSPLLPPAFRTRYFARCEPDQHAPGVDTESLASFFGSVTAQLEQAADLRLSDHSLGAHYEVQDDDGERMIAIAALFRAKAGAIADAIGRLPFPQQLATSLPAWRAAAAEQSAFLVPTSPSLHGLRFGARLLGGKERHLEASIFTAWTREGPTTRVEVNLHDATVPKTSWAELEGEGASELARAVLAAFPVAHPRHGGATLERAGFTRDPRELLPALQVFLSWVLHTRGERRADSPYR